MFQGHRKLNLHQLTRSFCSSCFEWCQSFYLRRWNGSGPPSYMTPHKKAMRYKTGRAAPPGCADEKNTDEKHFQFIWGPTTDFYVTTFFQPKRKVQKVTLLLGSAILQYFSIKIIVHPNHNLLTLMLFQTRINLFCGAQKLYLEELKSHTMKPNGVKKNTLDCTNKQQDIFQNIIYVPQKKESLTGLGRHEVESSAPNTPIEVTKLPN